MRNIKLTIEYDGTNYSGWQIQKNAITIQQVLEEALEKLIGNKVALIGSSRTDAKVHARGMAANFKTCCTIPVEKFPAAINSFLPDDIVVLDAKEVSEGFHSRYSCTGKRYTYRILNRRIPSALLRNYTAFVPLPLDFEEMVKAEECFIGVHDFSAFMASGSSVKTTVRNIRRLDIYKDGDIITIDIEADGFLYNMVRIIAGTLIDVGRGRKNPDEIADIIAGRDRSRAGKTAPPQGLCLEEVYY